MRKLLVYLRALLVWGKGIISFLIVLVLSLLLLKQEPEEKQALVDYLFSSVLYPSQWIVSQVHLRNDLMVKNEALLQENARLADELNGLIQARIENKRLLEALELPQHAEYGMVMGRVVARNPGQMRLSLVIDAGRDREVERNMPVFTPQGVVGRVSKVFSRHSHVQLLEDPTSKVSVLENRTRTMGILETTDSHQMYANFPKHAPLLVGDTIVTSGFGGIFPKGMFVGLIKSIQPSEVEVLQKAVIELMQDPLYLEEVFVLKKKPEWILKEER